MLEEVIAVDKIEVLESGHVQVRVAHRVLKDGVQIAARYQRHVLTPGDDLTAEDPKVRAVAEAAWREHTTNGAAEPI